MLVDFGFTLIIFQNDIFWNLYFSKIENIFDRNKKMTKAKTFLHHKIWLASRSTRLSRHRLAHRGPRLPVLVILSKVEVHVYTMYNYTCSFPVSRSAHTILFQIFNFSTVPGKSSSWVVFLEPVLQGWGAR